MLYDPSPPASRVARAVRALPDPERGSVLGFHPVARMNPFQALLYSRAHWNGYVPVGVENWSDIGALRVASLIGGRADLHLHWTSGVLGPAVDEEDARRRAREFIDELRSLQADGVRIVWTVHNVLPHGCVYPAIESEMRAELVALADLVHAMAAETIESTAEHYAIPAGKTINVPHPSYIGAYPSHLDRDNVRFEMGYGPDDFVVAAVGSIQPYKGLAELAATTRELSIEQPNLRVVVAGLVGRDPGSADLLEMLHRESHIDVMSSIEGERALASVVTAADTVALPYRASLNSGAALLALSLGTPIVAPRMGSFRSIIEEGMGVGYDPEDDAGLRSALLAMSGFASSFDRRGAIEAMTEISGEVVSEWFFTQLNERLRES